MPVWLLFLSLEQAVSDLWSETQQTALFSFAFSKFLTWGGEKVYCLAVDLFYMFVCLFVCLHSPFSGRREVFSAIQLSETSALCGYCLYGSAVFGVFPLYLFFLNGRAILKRLFASDQSTICNWR